jgi:hypothetical protein
VFRNFFGGVAARARLGETGVGAPVTECTSAMGTGSESSPSSPSIDPSKTRVIQCLHTRGYPIKMLNLEFQVSFGFFS